MPSPVDILVARGIPAETVDSRLGALVRVESSRVADAVAVLWELGFDFLVDLFGADVGEAVEVTYHVRKLAAHEELYLRCVVPYDGELPSIWRSFPAALYPEREAAELFGFALTGHANPKRLLTTDAVGPLLRKSVPIRTPEEVQRPYE